jgi:4-hydroxy-tetrahydrodipicolinate synthase
MCKTLVAQEKARRTIEDNPMTQFKGSITALVTPFKDGAVDEAAFRSFINWQIQEGTNGLVPVGTTGESPTLSHKEHERVVEICVEEAKGRVPVIAGAGSNSTAEAVAFSKHAEKVGADAVLIVTPYYNKPTQEGLYQHYKALAESTSLPIVVYNVPGRTGINVEPQTLVRLSELPNIVAVKEASGNVSQMCEICATVRKDFIVLSGDDALTLPLMAVGGHGIISVASNEAPAEMAQMVELAEKGDFAGARKIHTTLMPLMQVNFIEANPGPAKAAMAAMGLLEEVYRLPMVSPRPASREKILQVVGRLNAVHS